MDVTSKLATHSSQAMIATSSGMVPVNMDEMQAHGAVANMSGSGQATPTVLIPGMPVSYQSQPTSLAGVANINVMGSLGSLGGNIYITSNHGIQNTPTQDAVGGASLNTTSAVVSRGNSVAPSQLLGEGPKVKPLGAPPASLYLPPTTPSPASMEKPVMSAQVTVKQEPGHTLPLAPVTKRRGRRKKSPSIIPVDPTIKRRRGRPRGNGPMGRKAGRRSRLLSQPRYTSILPRPDMVGKGLAIQSTGVSASTVHVGGSLVGSGGTLGQVLPDGMVGVAVSGGDDEGQGSMAGYSDGGLNSKDVALAAAHCSAALSVGTRRVSLLEGGESSKEVAVAAAHCSAALSIGKRRFVLEEKRRQLLLKARADKVKRKETRHLQRSVLLSQRKLAQRQRRERERMAQRLARERQDKMVRLREEEDRVVHRQHVAKQQQAENQRRAQERTMRLLAHLRRQEVERNRRLYQQQLDLEKAEQLKHPTEDLEVRETSSLSSLPPLGWIRLPAEAFSDLLMVIEFSHSFEEFLELEPSPPLLSEVYLALYNGGGGKVMMDLCGQLLKAAIYDPSCDAVTVSGCPIETMDINIHTLSELLRLFLADRAAEAGMDHILQSLETLPVQCLRPSDKVKVLGFLVDELLSSDTLTKEVDTRMEQVASLRRDKWKISLKMKRFRSCLSSKFGVTNKLRPVAYSGRGRPPKGTMAILGDVSSDEEEDPAQSEVAMVTEMEMSDKEYSEEESDEETSDDKDVLQKRIKSLKQKLLLIRTRIHQSSHTLRKFPLGQDRYARQYWVLPSMGGVLIEGVETSLDSNLQLGVKGAKEEGEEKGDDLGEPSSSDATVIIREDLRQPLGVRGLGVGEDIEGPEDPLPHGVGVAATPGVGVATSSMASTSSGVAALGMASASGVGVASTSGHYSGVVVIEDRDETTYPLVVPGPSPLSGQQSQQISATSGSDVMESEPSALAVRGSRMETEENTEAMQVEIDEDIGGECVHPSLSVSMHEQYDSASTTAPQQLGSTSVSDHSLPFTEPLQLSSTPVGSTQHHPAPVTEPMESLQMECEQDSVHVVSDVESPEKSDLTDASSFVVEPESVDGQAQSSPADGASLVSVRDHWFSLFPRHSCETTKVVYSSGDVSNTPTTNQPASVVSPDPAQLPTQQAVLAAAGATPTQQYVYVTPDGQVVGMAQPPQAAASVPQVVGGGSNVAYAVVGNSLVPVVGQQQQQQQPQYVAVNPGSATTQQQPQYVAINPGSATTQQQYVAVNPGSATTQQGMQYVLAQPDPQGGMQYYAVGGTPSEGGGGAVGGGAWQAQPQFLAVADANGQQQLMQVVGRDDGGQMLVQVPQDQAQGGQSGGQVVMGQSGGQVVMAAATPQQGNQVVVGQGQSGGQVVLATPQQGDPVVVGQGQSGQMVLATPQGNQLVVGQGQSGQMILSTPQGNQVVLGQGQSGQMVLATPQGNQVVVGHGQSGQMVLAAPQGNQMVIGQGQSTVTPTQQQVLVGDQFGHSSTAADPDVLGDGVGSQDGLDIVRGGQVVKLPDQEQYGILSRDGTKLILAESKEAAFCTLQAASGVSGFLPAQQQSHASLAPPSNSPTPLSQSLLTQHQQAAYSVPKIKEEPQSPSFEEASQPVGATYTTSSVVATPTPPPSGKATPTTVGLSTSAAETIDLTRQPSPPGQEFITAVLPAGPNGESQYVSLPADPRVMSGQYSYAMLQQPDGSQSIVLVENSSDGSGYSQQNSTPDNTSSGNTLTVTIPSSGNHTPSMTPPSQMAAMECPPHTLMCNESEGDPWMIDITLMYAQETPYQPGLYGRRVSPSVQHKPVVKKNEPPKERTNEKSLRELLEEQDIDLTHGWWSISDSSTMDKLLRSFCLRGFREKSLFKAIQKNKETFYQMFNPSNLQDCKDEFLNLLSQLSLSGKAITEGERVKGQEGEGVTAARQIGGENAGMDTSDGKDKQMEVTGQKVSLGESSQQEKAKKEENADDKSDSDESSDSDSDSSSSSDSSESGGVKPRLSTSSRSSNLILRSHLAVSLRAAHKIPQVGVFDPVFLELVDQFAVKVLEYVEGMEDRLFVAQLHEENCKQWDKLSSRVQELGVDEPLLPMISEKLLHLEVITCRKYLKPPLRDSKVYAEESPRVPPKSGRGGRGRDRSSNVPRYEAPPIELPSEGLSMWRAAVERATSASQLAVCASQLERCVTWEKSSSVVFCQVCHSGENESLLLLCDGCDRGTHTYCCKPELSDIPAGDWYCRECLVNNSKIKPCYVCDSTRGVLLTCIICPKTFHKRCLNPPLKRVPAPPWKCPYCKYKSIPKSRAPKANSAHNGGGRKRQPKDGEGICRLIMDLMNEHDDAWPFLEPVEKKKFPEYYKVIKKPIDLRTMTTKLEDGKYAGNKDSFAADARQMFTNCAYYNEDNSEIGVSGHSLRAFFEKMWAVYNSEAKN